jgi:hypothetical protein
MFRFDRLIRPSMTVREIRARYPETAEVFEALGFRSVCDDCALETIARRQSLSTDDVLSAVQRVIDAHEANHEHQH